MTVPAPGGVLYGLIADATVWPLFFPPCVHVEQLDFGGTRERLRMWAVMDGRISSWVSHRHLDAGRRRVEFRQERPSAPVETMTGVWTVLPFGDGSRVTLEHAFTVVGDAPADVAWTERVTRANSRAQLRRLAWLAERWTRLDDLVVTFEDTVRAKVPAETVLDFLYRAGDWPDDLVDARPLTVREDTPGIQVLSLDGRSATGREAVRISFPGAGRLVHKHTRTSGPLAAYTGEWTVEPRPGAGFDVTVRHDVLLDDDAGPDGDAARGACDEVGRAGRRLLEHAVRHAHEAVRVL
ncbi:cyclase [Streptomyces coelicoflavus]|uniref:Cyclase n=1 Tax=Streptomyces coelicoflavus TaxID=285562 RepID=A0A7K3PVL9_9ACTN|nr:SRPBCC family protein [Streptomyces coelicoflavus]NEB13857.1 cyclase [Streptomyces coelicoflavus]